MKHRILPSVVLVLCSLVAFAAEAVVEVEARPAGEEATRRATVAPALRPLEWTSVEPLASLRAAADVARAELEEIAAWNSSGRTPMRNGFVRNLPTTRRVALEGATVAETRAHAGGVVTRTTDGGLVWAAEIRVADARSLRLQLSDIHLPAGTSFWVYAPGGEQARSFGLELSYANELWTPSIYADAIRLEVHVPAARADGAWSFDIARVAELVALDGDGRPLLVSTDPTLVTRQHDYCLVDGMCISASTFPGIGMARNGVARYNYMSGTSGFACSGSLIGDSQGSSIPYFLTAWHCVSTPSEVASIEAFFKATTTGCNGSPIPESQLPRANGATLLATEDTGSDFTLARFSSIPGGLTLLGWSTASLANGTPLHRLSHPAPVQFAPQRPQMYSRGLRLTNPQFVCSERPPSRYVYSSVVQGGTFAGSSGSAIMIAGAKIVGQQFGACGDPPFDGCDTDISHEVDGKFSVTYSSVKQWLDPDDPGSSCPGGFFSDPEFPDFCYTVTITPPGQSSFPGTQMDPSECLGETVCVSGALATRAEAFVRIVGPKPNGYLWPTLVKFTTSEITIQIHQISKNITKTYVLDGASPGSSELEGLFDRMGFLP